MFYLKQGRDSTQSVDSIQQQLHSVSCTARTDQTGPRGAEIKPTST